MKNTQLSAKLTFVGYLAFNIIFRIGESVAEVRQEAIKENDPNKATPSDRAAALMSNGLTSALSGIAIALMLAGVYVLFDADSSALLWLFMTPGVALLFSAAWYYVRLFPAERAYEQWKLNGWEEDDIADESLFVSNSEFTAVAVGSLLLAIGLATAVFGFPL